MCRHIEQLLSNLLIWGWAFNDNRQSYGFWLPVRIAAKLIIPTYPWVIQISIYLWLKYPHPPTPTVWGGGGAVGVGGVGVFEPKVYGYLDYPWICGYN